MQEIYKNLNLEDLPGEEWRDIILYQNGVLYDYSGYYQVSNYGRVKSLDRTIKYSDGHYQNVKSRIMKQNDDGSGYLQLELRKNGIGIHHKTHRLVGFAFIINNNPISKPEIDHINGDKHDNCVSNLRWADDYDQANNEITKEKGIKSRKESEKCKEANRKNQKKAAESNKKKVLCITTGQTFDSTAEASKYYNINRHNISKCCRGERNYCGKLSDGTRLEWKYIE